MIVFRFQHDLHSGYAQIFKFLRKSFVELCIYPRNTHIYCKKIISPNKNRIPIGIESNLFVIFA